MSRKLTAKELLNEIREIKKQAYEYDYSQKDEKVRRKIFDVLLNEGESESRASRVLEMLDEAIVLAGLFGENSWRKFSKTIAQRYNINNKTRPKSLKMMEDFFMGLL